MERFLQNSVENAEYMPPEGENYAIDQIKKCNWMVTHVTTPANLMHVWRRQMHLPFRKPCICMAPKSMLKDELARSSFADVAEGTQFQRLIPESGPASQNPSGVKKLVFCSGRVYYDFFRARKEKNKEAEIAIARVEQVVSSLPLIYELNASIFYLFTDCFC